MQDTSSTRVPTDDGGAVDTVLARLGARPVVVSVLVALFIAVLVRSYIYGAVFRSDSVVLLANDPYFYRFVVEQHVAAANGDVGALLRYDGRDPFLVVTLSLVVVLLGGLEQAPLVLAWYPVVVGVLTVALVYVFGALVSHSRTVGVVSAVALALAPAHVARTALGFSDHHAADFLWLVATATLLALCWQRLTIRRRLLVVPPLAVVLAVQVVSWEGGVVLVAPAALAVVLGSVLDVADGRRPVAGLTAAGSFVGAAVLLTVAVGRFGWRGPDVALVFGLLAASVAVAVGVLAVVEAVDAPAWTLPGVVGALVVGIVAVGLRSTPLDELLETGLIFLEVSNDSGIVETVSLVGGPFGVVTGPFSLFGLQLFVALPLLVLSSVHALRRRDAGLAVLSVYAWYFLAFALVQRRFAGELSPYVAVLVGIAVVALARRTEILPSETSYRPLLPSALAGLRRFGPAAFSVFLVVLVVSSSAVVAVKLNQSVVTDAEYGAAEALDAYAGEYDLTYPESYVLSSLGTNRFYNYEVNADSAPDLSYRYAESYYASFVYSDEPAWQYWQHAERVGFVVTDDAGATRFATPTTVYRRLHDNLGSRDGAVEGTGHYRLVYASDDDSVKAFALVPGAVVVGTAAPGERIDLSVPVTVGDRSFVYARETTVTDVGWYAVTVPYAGTYTVDGQSVTVTDEAVVDGTFVHVGDRPASTGAHWPLDADSGPIAFDVDGGHHGRILGPTWTDDGLSFRGVGGVTVATPPTPTSETGLALTVRFTDLAPVERDDSGQVRFQRLVAATPSGQYTESDGYQLGIVDGRVIGAVGDDSNGAFVRGPEVDDGAPHTVSLLWDGETLRLVLDGELVGETPYDGAVSDGPLRIGGTTDDQYQFRGVITDVRLDLVAASELPPTHEH